MKHWMNSRFTPKYDPQLYNFTLSIQLQHFSRPPFKQSSFSGNLSGESCGWLISWMHQLDPLWNPWHGGPRERSTQYKRRPLVGLRSYHTFDLAEHWLTPQWWLDCDVHYKWVRSSISFINLTPPPQLWFKRYINYPDRDWRVVTELDLLKSNHLTLRPSKVNFKFELLSRRQQIRLLSEDAFDSLGSWRKIRASPEPGFGP